ncbi:MAG: hypothetical protein ABH881_03230 [bacterium]
MNENFKEKPIKKEKPLNEHLEDLKRVVELWSSLSNKNKTDDGLNEGDTRRLETRVVRNLIDYLQNCSKDEIENNKQELIFVVNEYLRIGDHMTLQKELAQLLGIKYYEPFSGEELEDGSIGPDLVLKSIKKEFKDLGLSKSKVADNINESIKKIDEAGGNKNDTKH